MEIISELYKIADRLHIPEREDPYKVPDLIYRGITGEEADYIARTGVIKSTGKFSVPGEGTCFASDYDTAESYVNFGRTSPDITGVPTYVIEVKSGPEVKIDPRDFYPKSKKSISASRITRAWKFITRDKPIPVKLVGREWKEI